ncbi:MAG: FAD-dependent oxidoreductase [Firmicutes bacterium]|nr:FAD-dependent oxidoreductase [Bacillota bacterium]
MPDDLYSPDVLYDVAVVGCGPAGLSAAITAKIRNKQVAVFGVEFCTPKLHSAEKVDNYLGFKDISGAKLRDRFFEHFHSMGLKERPGRVDSILPIGDRFNLVVKTDVFQARTVILATGVATTKYLPGEKDLIGKGVSYCATCDANLYKNKDVAVLGYCGEAVEEANFLAEICNKVYFVKQFKGVVHLDPKVEVITEKPLGIVGQERVSKLSLQERNLDVDGVFIVREVTPAAQLVPGLEMTKGAIHVKRNLSTNIPGVFAAGDCTGAPLQLAKAVGEGNVAAISAAKYLDNLKR